MRYAGKALCLGDHIDTDAIIPARFLVTSDPAELGTHCMEGLDPLWIAKVAPGKSLLVAGRNFGCGSSREHAPVAILAAGINVVLAHSFARIFYRNAFNMGLLPLEVGEACANFSEGDEVEVDMAAGRVSNKNTGQSFPFPPLPESMRAILEAGGLIPFVRKRLCAGHADS
ncbi:MAG: 3-isopropylmalate dehydratase small subunit [Deltaproteobacteria bacterium]|jgi:3-isopropylmalate/(R)-2-methylmalate dehydratase small subunit|nr:3-isopropylmalate dehydratase small subunit [Deltaproteobacteria bacterium]